MQLRQQSLSTLQQAGSGAAAVGEMQRQVSSLQQQLLFANEEVRVGWVVGRGSSPLQLPTPIPSSTLPCSYLTSANCPPLSPPLSSLPSADQCQAPRE